MKDDSRIQSSIGKELASFEKRYSDTHYVARPSQYNPKGRRIFEIYQDSINLNQTQDEQTYKDKQKLKQIMKHISHMKNQRRAHELVQNLPSRMIKSFDQNKFNLLDDKAYIFDEKFFQQSIINHSKIQQIQDDKSVVSIEVQNNKLRQVSLTDIGEQNSKTQQKSLKKILIQKLEQCTLDFKRTCKRIFHKGMRYFDNIPTLSPSHSIKLVWDILNMIVVLICMFYLPIAITFRINMSDLISQQLTFVIPIFLILDILINMNTGYFDKGQVINSRLKIIRKFLNEKLFRDVISIFPFLVLVYKQMSSNLTFKSLIEVNNTTNQYILDLLQMIFYFKIFTLSSTLWKIEERFNLSTRYSNQLQLAKLLFTILLINHLFACLWVYTAKLEINAGYQITWMSYDNIVEKDWGSQYLSAFYFTTLTMITVGYGDILPRTNVEMVLCITTMMLSCGVFGYTINQIGTIFNSILYVDNYIKQQISQIQRFMSKKSINTQLQYQIREYLEYYWREKSEMNQEQEQIIIEQLSESLRQKLLFEANKIVLKDSPIFKQNFSKAVIEQTVPLIKEIKFPPESCIFLKGVQDDGAIYFIENGSVEIVLDQKNKNGKVLFQLNKGDSFGAHSFFTGFPRINFIRSKEFTTVLKIRRQEFLQLIQRFPEDYETFCSIKDSICYLDDYSRIGLKCQSCSSNYHLVNECKYLHFIPKKARIIKTYNNSFNIQNVSRVPYERRHSKNSKNYQHTLIIIKEVQKQVYSQIYLIFLFKYLG